MAKRIVLAVLAMMLVVPAMAQTAALPIHACNQPGTQALTSGLKSTNYQMGVVPYCTVTVYLTGTTTLATTTPQTPLTANVDGSIPPIYATINQGYDVIGSGGIAPNNYPEPVNLCTDCYPSFSFTPGNVGCTTVTAGGDCVQTDPGAGITQSIVQQPNTDFDVRDSAAHDSMTFYLPTTANTGGYFNSVFVDGTTFKTNPSAAIIVGAGPSTGFNGPMGASIQTWPEGANAPAGTSNYGDGVFVNSEYANEDYLQNQAIHLYSYNGGFININAASSATTPANGINLFGNVAFNVPAPGANPQNYYNATHTMTWAEYGGGVLHQVDATGGAFTLTLPPAAGPGNNTTAEVIFWKSDATANAVTIAPAAGDTIAGAGANPQLTTLGATIELIADGTHTWYQVGGGSSSGSGTVNSGTANQLAYYAANGTAVSGTNAVPNGTTATTQTVGDNTAKLATDAFVLANALSNPMTTLGDTIYGGASGASTRLAGPTAGTTAYNYCSTPSGGAATAPAWCLPGIGGRTVTAATDTIAAADRGNVITYNSASAVAVTLTSAATVGSNFDFAIINIGAGTVTLTPGAGTITYGTTSGGASLAVAEGTSCSISSPDNTNYVARCAPYSAAGSGIANIQITVGTTAIAANTCTSASTATMTGLATTSTVKFTPSVDVSSTTGWSPASTGQLYFTAWPTANTLNYKVCNGTSASITPGASTTWNVSAQ